MKPKDNTIPIKNPGQRLFYKYALILVLILILGVAATIIVYYNYYLMNYIELSSSLNISNSSVGLNTNTKVLAFGKVPLGGGSTRYFTLSTQKRALIRIVPTGDIKQFISFSDNNFILEPGQQKRVLASVDIPDNATLGGYTGKVKIYFFRS